MSNEIKEILDKLKDREETYKFCKQYKLAINDWIYEAHYLLDYITNLQQENKEWGMIFDTFSKRPYAHRYLEEKRKELGNKRIIGLDSEMIYKEYYDLKEIEQEHKKINGELRERISYLERSNDRREDTILGLRQEINDVEDKNSKLEIALQNLQQINKNQAKRNSRQRLANQKQQDLILNLQQELEEEERIEEADLKTIQKLEEENERLKDELKWWQLQCDDLEMQAGVDYE